MTVCSWGGGGAFGYSPMKKRVRCGGRASCRRRVKMTTTPHYHRAVISTRRVAGRRKKKSIQQPRRGYNTIVVVGRQFRVRVRVRARVTGEGGRVIARNGRYSRSFRHSRRTPPVVRARRVTSPGQCRCVDRGGAAAGPSNRDSRLTPTRPARTAIPGTRFTDIAVWFFHRQSTTVTSPVRRASSAVVRHTGPFSVRVSRGRPSYPSSQSFARVLPVRPCGVPFSLPRVFFLFLFTQSVVPRFLL